MSTHAAALRNPELVTLRGGIEAIRRESAALLAGHDAAALNRTPGKGIWSVGQQFDHLNKVGGLCLPGMRAAVADLRARNATAAGPARYGAFERFSVAMMNPSGWMRWITVPVPRLYAPSVAPLDPAALAADFDRLQADFLALLIEADGLDLRAATVPSPETDKVRLSVGAWLHALTAHERYHLAKAVKAASA